MEIDFVSLNRKWTVYASLILAPIVATLPVSVGTEMSVARGQMATLDDASDPATKLHPAFLKALEGANAARTADGGSMVDITALFQDFHRYKTVDPYIEYFKILNIQPITAPGNQKSFLYFNVDFAKLRSLGHGAFAPRDRLVILFSTKSATSREITSFKATIVNSGGL